MSAELSADPPESQRTQQSSGVDRRKFLGTAGLTASAVITASVAPLAARAASGFTASPLAPAASTVTSPSEELWDVDDMWGHRPRYAHPIPYARVQPSPPLWEQIDPIDRVFAW